MIGTTCQGGEGGGGGGQSRKEGAGGSDCLCFNPHEAGTADSLRITRARRKN